MASSALLHVPAAAAQGRWTRSDFLAKRYYQNAAVGNRNGAARRSSAAAAAAAGSDGARATSEGAATAGAVTAPAVHIYRVCLDRVSPGGFVAVAVRPASPDDADADARDVAVVSVKLGDGAGAATNLQLHWGLGTEEGAAGWELPEEASLPEGITYDVASNLCQALPEGSTRFSGWAGGAAVRTPLRAGPSTSGTYNRPLSNST